MLDASAGSAGSASVGPAGSIASVSRPLGGSRPLACGARGGQDRDMIKSSGLLSFCTVALAMLHATHAAASGQASTAAPANVTPVRFKHLRLLPDAYNLYKVVRASGL